MSASYSGVPPANPWNDGSRRDSQSPPPRPDKPSRNPVKWYSLNAFSIAASQSFQSNSGVAVSGFFFTSFHLTLQWAQGEGS